MINTINTIEQLNEAILQGYEFHSLEFCYDPRNNVLIFFNTNNDVTSSFYIKPLLDRGFEIEAIKKHTATTILQAEIIMQKAYCKKHTEHNAVHYEDEEEIPHYSISLKEG